MRTLAALILGVAIAAGSGSSVVGRTAPAGGLDITTLELDRDGADIFPAEEFQPARSLDATMLALDCDGADIPAGNWWGFSSNADREIAAIASQRQGPDITGLNLDHNGADVFAD